MFPYVIGTFVEVRENSKYRGNPRPARAQCVPTSIFRSPKLPTLVFSVTVWKYGKCFLFLKYKLTLKWNNLQPIFKILNFLLFLVTLVGGVVFLLFAVSALIMGP